MNRLKVKSQEQRLKPEFRLAGDLLDLRTLNTNVIINHLEHNLKLRQMTLQDRLKKKIIQ